jgi:hypothetical protein
LVIFFYALYPENVSMCVCGLPLGAYFKPLQLVGRETGISPFPMAHTLTEVIWNPSLSNSSKDTLSTVNKCKIYED